MEIMVLGETEGEVAAGAQVGGEEEGVGEDLDIYHFMRLLPALSKRYLRAKALRLN